MAILNNRLAKSRDAELSVPRKHFRELGVWLQHTQLLSTPCLFFLQIPAPSVPGKPPPHPPSRACVITYNSETSMASTSESTSRRMDPDSGFRN